MKNFDMWLFEDFETHRNFFIIITFVVALNVQLIKYGSRMLNKNLWKVHETNHEEILETIKIRVDPHDSLD